MARTAADSFPKRVIAAFPSVDRLHAEDAVDTLSPFIDGTYHTYHQKSVEVVVRGAAVRVPSRLQFHALNVEHLESHPRFAPATLCLLTRSTDGYLRQASLRQILGNSEPWCIPFIVLLAGEYVVEITEDLAGSLIIFEQNKYVAFVRENRPLMRRLRSQAASYWNCYYREQYPDKSKYPGLVFLHRLEHWAV